MFFSAAANFGAAGALGLIGFFTLKAAKDKTLLALACIPLLFALQQLSEGILWLALQRGAVDENIAETFKFIYLLLAFFIWPIWIPLSLVIPEKIAWRRILLITFLLFGLMLSVFCASYLPDNTLIAKIVNRKMEYSMQRPFELNPWLMIGWYSAVVILPTFISSLKLAWLLGLCGSISWIISEYFYHDNFTTSWSFFGALISVLIYLVIKADSSQVTKTAQQQKQG